MGQSNTEPSSARRTTTGSCYIDKLILFLTSVLLALSGVGLLLIPGRMGTVTDGLAPIIEVGLGLGLFLVSWANQTAVFIDLSLRIKKVVSLLSMICLGFLGYLYFQAHLWIDVVVLLTLSFSHIYLFFYPGYLQQKHIDYSLLGSGILNLATGILLLFMRIDFSGYENLAVWKLPLGGIFGISGIIGAAAYVWRDKPASRVMAKITALAWLAWSVFFSFALQINTVLITIGVGVLPFIADAIPWSNLSPSKDGFLRRNTLLAAEVVETILLLSLIMAGHVSRQFPLASSVTRTAMTALNQDFTFISMITVKGVLLFGLFVIALTHNKLAAELPHPNTGALLLEDTALIKWFTRTLRSQSPSQNAQTRLGMQAEQIAALSQQLNHEKQRNAQYNLLLEMSYQLEAQLDLPVAAQIAGNTLHSMLHCSQVTIYEHDLKKQEFSVIASAGNLQPPDYRQQTSQGVLGRTLRLRKTQIVGNSEFDPDFIPLGDYAARSLLTVPLIHHGHIRAVLEIGDDKVNAFDSHDIQLVEKVGNELMRAWERSSYRERLTNLIKAGISLSPLFEPQTTIKEIATLARDTLRARFIFVMFLDQEGNFSRVAHAGQAPHLLNSLTKCLTDDYTIKAALNAHAAFRIRDIRKYNKDSHIEIDHAGLRSLLAIPIRLHRLSIGAILAFGKQGEIFFSENDESLASLLSSQAATVIEATWLYQELRNTLNSTTQLYNLSVNVIQAEKLDVAAQHIAETAAKVSNARMAGIVLYSKEQTIDIEVEIDEYGAHPGQNHPIEMIQQAIQSGQSIHISPDQVSATICFPLQTPLRKYGALWLEVPNIREYFSRQSSNMQTLVNQAALALERSILLVESQRQAQAIESAFQELELSYDRTLAALMSALDARDSETEGHSLRVSELSRLLGEALGLDEDMLKALERGSLLHDIGKIGVSDSILHKPTTLDEEEWEMMRLHPDIGARIVEGIPFLEDTIPVIRYHQERWDGSGYPIGLCGEDIPVLARIFAVVDAFDALTSDRPYRTPLSYMEAFQYLKEQAGVLFDPKIVSLLEKLVLNKKIDALRI